ncbi:MAG: tetraacyldisaccharide 4'-kinase, partial [Bdellovibrionales bacterium]|nr:tetraacyldisaccharide 4'-kinase [Bdellovibrionales bacterium]
ITAPFLFLASAVWSTATRVVRWAYRFGLFKRVRLPVRVISVGNFEVGGTGKTPVVAKIAREAISRGITVVILSRGYGGQWERSGGVISPSADTSMLSTEQTGDETALLHELVPQAWIGVGANRVASFYHVMKLARETHRPVPDLVILDDGLQHHRIHRDLDIVLMTSARPWKKVFREFPSQHLSVPAIFIWTKGALSPAVSWKDPEIMKARWSVSIPQGDSSLSRLWLVTGVAESGYVRELLESQGWNIARFSQYPDHAQYSQKLLEQLTLEAEAQGMVLATTGKDWVKWKEKGVKRDSIRVFEPEMVFEDRGEKLWSHKLWGESL